MGRAGALAAERARTACGTRSSVEPDAAALGRARGGGTVASRRPRLTCGRCRCSRRRAAAAVPPASVAGAPRRVAVVLAVAGTLWLRDTVELLRFMVALFGRLPIVTPVYVVRRDHAACAGVMVVPPFIAAAAAATPAAAAVARDRALLCCRSRSPPGCAYFGAGLHLRPAAAPQRARAARSPTRTTAIWEVGSHRAGTRSRARRAGWLEPPVRTAPPASVPWGAAAAPLRVPHHRPVARAPHRLDVARVHADTAVAAGTELTMTSRAAPPGR